MNSATDSLIATLVKDMREVIPAAHPVHLLAGWLSVSFIAVMVMLCCSGLRPDLAMEMHQPGFAAEILLLLLMILTSGMAAVVISFPDYHQKRWLVFAPLLPFGAFVLLLATEWAMQPAAVTPHGIECLACICLYSLLPALAMMRLLRKQATVHSDLAGMMALLAASSVGCLAIRLTEETDSIAHLVLWHYLPFMGFALLGVVLGRRWLRW